MKVPVLSSLVLFHARQAGGEYHSLLPSGGGPRTHTGESQDHPNISDILISIDSTKNNILDATTFFYYPHTHILNQKDDKKYNFVNDNMLSMNRNPCLSS